MEQLVEFCQNHMFLTLLKWLNVSYPSMFANLCIYYTCRVAKKLTKILSPIQIT